MGLCLALLAAAPTAIVAGQGHSDSCAVTGQQASPEDSLNDVMIILARAFRTRNAEALSALLPAQGKVFLSLSTIGGGAGYFGPDQVYFIFSAIFARYDSIRFDIRPQKAAAATSEQERPGLSYCIANWAFRNQDGRAEKAQIHFVLCMKNGSWSLMEIREAR